MGKKIGENINNNHLAHKLNSLICTELLLFINKDRCLQK